MSLDFYHVDAFADRAFTGNPAAVVILDEPVDDQWKQALATELNFSETAFVLPRGESCGTACEQAVRREQKGKERGKQEGEGEEEEGVDLQWFTPAAEVELCGHATLASAHVLWETGRLPPDQPALFHTRYSGLLRCERTEKGVRMDFPADPPAPALTPPRLDAALGVRPVCVCQSRYDYLCELESERAVRSLTPDWALLSTLDVRGVIVTARSDDPAFDCVSRFFAPRLRVHEDPVTGSAHCVLGPYWSERLGKAELIAYQASPRGGVVGVAVNGDRVHLTGQAVTLIEGRCAAPGEGADPVARTSRPSFP